MKQLEELEKKITTILEKNQKLAREVNSYKEANQKLEESILKEHVSIDELNKEKNAIKIAIEALLKNIDQLEEIKE